MRELAHVGTVQAHRRQQRSHAFGCLRGLDQALLEQRLGDDVADAPARIEAGVGILEDHLHAPAQRLSRLARAFQRGLHVDPV